MDEHEYAQKIDGFLVGVSKDGGGTIGKAYDGTWTVTVMNGPEFVLDNQTLHTGALKTHAEVAREAVEFAWTQMDEEN